MAKLFAFIYGMIAYIIFLVTFLYAIGFVGNLVVSRSIDSPPEGPFVDSLLVDIALLSLFALQHSVMARQGFKGWWTRLIPKPIERSTYVLVSSLALLLLFRQWRPITTIVWEVGNPTAQRLLEVLFWLGRVIALHSTFLIDHADLFGLKQVYLYARGKD